MPGTITHFWIFYQTLRRLPHRGIVGDMQGSLDSLMVRLRRDHGRWLSNYDYAQYSTDSLLASYGFLGAAGPDLFLAPDDSLDAMGHIDGIELSDLMHYNKTGSLIIFMLNRIKRSMNLSQSATRNMRMAVRLAYCIGHITHIAADVTAHPLVNTMAGAYHTNQPQQFENSEGSNTINIFKMHHKVEHYQDSYVRTEFFRRQAQLLDDDWEMLAFPRTACRHIDSSTNNRFIVQSIENFYHYRVNTLHGSVTADDEGGKMDYFFDDSTASSVSFRNYYVNIIPTMNRMQSEHNAQNRSDLETVVQPSVFGPFTDRCITLATNMVQEAISFLYDGINYANGNPQDIRDMYQEKRQTFPLLRKAWNLDCGIGYRFESTPDTASFQSQSNTLHLPVKMHMVSRPV